MKTISEFPHKTKVIDGVFIPLGDGIKLAAKIWLPEDADINPVPAILEYLPYRYQDGTADRDALTHPYFAGHGYASVRVDMRGSGNSEGVLLGEYLKQEQDDALEVIDWITQQQWCSGEVGMIGISWGGFNGSQIAARRPAALKAIVTICSTDDRYADDIHYMGGAMLLDNIAWSTYMFSINTTPPDPELHGNSWQDIWRERLTKSGLWLENWLEHQHRDEFYKHGSVCENYDDIECAVYAVGGWADGYSNSVFRLMSNLSAPFKGLIGPWAHKYPHFASPGPAIGFLQECLRWWDQWLKGSDTGIMNEPKLRCWTQDTIAPKTRYDYRPGCWVAENQWPSPNIHKQVLYIRSDGLGTQPESTNQSFMIQSPQTVGLHAGVWCPHGINPDLPGDQRQEAGGSLNFDSEVLKEDVEILGAPVFEAELACNQTNGLLAVCLNEVLSDGASTRITYGVLNLTHRNGHENPQPLIVGKTYCFKVQLNDIAHRFKAGSTIRLSLSNSYWPIVWPSPHKTVLSLSTGSLELPVRPPVDSDAELAEFLGPESAKSLSKTVDKSGENFFAITENIDNGEVILRNSIDEGRIVYDDYDGWTVESAHVEIFSIHPDEPNSAKCDITWTERFSRGDWNVSSRTNTIVTSTPTHFNLDARLEAWNGPHLVHEQNWHRKFKRQLV